ncbi:MAG TPA: hypothetical protein VLH35_05435 [Candidatus Acidoferrales bacterium]|nr:hypothetical protein [Candidatus Acidoferrales bacterium]
MPRKLQKKQLLILAILIALTVNVISFCVAFPDITKLEFETVARDFSAYYMGAWRLYNNPTQVYYDGSLPGDYAIVGTPQPFKYTPSFLILMTPFLALDYMDALVIFNFIQLALMPLLAFFVYKLVKDKNILLAAIAAIIALITVLPTPASNIPYTEPIHLGLIDINSQCFAPSYYCGYVYINAHILQAVFLVGALYFASTKKPVVSAVLFSFGLLDPRAALVAVPLLLWYNRQKIRKFLIASIVVGVVTLLPFFFYYDIGMTFLRMGLSTNIIGQSYAYDWIPIYGVVSLSIVEFANVLNIRRKKKAIV